MRAKEKPAIIEIGKKIAKLFRSDDYAVSEVCRIVGITSMQYKAYFEKYEDFADLIMTAKKERNELLCRSARRSLLKLVEGVETTTTYESNGKDGEAKKTVTTYKLAPDWRAVEFVLTNFDEDFKEDKEGAAEKDKEAIFTVIHKMIDNEKDKKSDARTSDADNK